MAKPSTDEKDDEERDEAEDADEASERAEAESSDEEVVDAEIRGSEDSSEPLAKVTLSADGGLAETTTEEDAEEEAAAQLGIQRYVLASFFAAGIVGAYILGRAVHGIWSWAANKDWFHNALPALAAVSDDDKTTYGTILGAVLAIVGVVQAYRRHAVRAWADEVAAELAKVKWPTRKEVSNSTVIVIAAGAIATLYLALLDRLWSFVTDLFYGTGS
jgi:preprotein translocase subunit SecE